MKLSIIIVNYHTDKLLRECLASISRQKTDFDYEVIVEDNSQRNIGFGAANNRGAAKAKGEYLFFLNPDTLLIEPFSLQNLVKYLDQNPAAAVVGPRLVDREGRFQWSANFRISLLQLILDKPLAVLYRYFGQFAFVESLLGKIMPRYEQHKTLTYIDRVRGAALLVRASVFRQIGGFDAKTFFLYFEDDDLNQRIRQVGWEVHFYPKVTVKHLEGQSHRNLAIKESIYYQSQDRYFAKHRPRWEQVLLRVFRLPYRALKLRKWINRYF